jgi:hypothetical protein
MEKDTNECAETEQKNKLRITVRNGILPRVDLLFPLLALGNNALVRQKGTPPGIAPFRDISEVASNFRQPALLVAEADLAY